MSWFVLLALAGGASFVIYVVCGPLLKAKTVSERLK
jgi:hypothetical protein